jgi:hypothetical protein
MQHITKIRKKNLTRWNTLSNILLFHIYMKLNRFGRHTAQYQEPNTALSAYGFSYVEGCRTCSWRPPATRPTTFHLWKTRGCQCSIRLLMMSGVLPETCWASYKYGIKRFWYLLASCWIFFMNCTMMHGSTNIQYHEKSPVPISF